MTKFFNKFKKPCLGAFFGLFSRFLGQFFFSPKHPALSRTISNGFVAPCRNLEKNQRYNSKKTAGQTGRKDRWRNGRKVGRILFYGTLLATAGGPKKTKIYLY